MEPSTEEQKRFIQAAFKFYANKAKEVMEEVKAEVDMKYLAQDIEQLGIGYIQTAHVIRELEEQAIRNTTAAAASPAARANKTGRKATDPLPVRQKIHPMYKNLGIPPPPGQQVGNERVPPGKKVKNYGG